MPVHADVLVPADILSSASIVLAIVGIVVSLATTGLARSLTALFESRRERRSYRWLYELSEDELKTRLAEQTVSNQDLTARLAHQIAADEPAVPRAYVLQWRRAIASELARAMPSASEHLDVEDADSIAAFVEAAERATARVAQEGVSGETAKD